MYRDGEGVPQDGAEALRWFRRAVEQGDTSWAPLNIGRMYRDGKSVPQDAAEAVRWFRLGAEQGDAFAQWELGRM